VKKNEFFSFLSFIFFLSIFENLSLLTFILEKRRTLINQLTMNRLFGMISSLILVILISLICSCEGPAGEDGLTGPSGKDGVDANDQCKVCHSQANHKLKVSQYNLSVHAAGLNVSEAGSRNDCARCHSHEGFVETNFTGRDTTAADILIATKIGCATCHTSHISFDTLSDGKDYALRVTDGVRLITSNDSKIIDFGTQSNGCAYCHQPLYGAPVANATGKYKVANSQFGPHHGPQATILFGVGAYEIAGVQYPASGTSNHFKSGACVTCHMGKTNGETGAHTFNASLANCTKCHSGATNFDVDGLQTTVGKMLVELDSLMRLKGMINKDGNILPANFPIDYAGAYYNYTLIKDDRSLGVHNPAYTIAVLKNSISSLN
jgi:hypothetical protein